MYRLFYFARETAFQYASAHLPGHVEYCIYMRLTGHDATHRVTSNFIGECVSERMRSALELE